MADPAASLEAALRAAFAAAFPEAADADPVVRPATDARFGDYQANGSMALAKRLGGIAPREIAQSVAASLDVEAAGVEPPEVAGPGFLNIRFTSAWLSARVTELLSDARMGITADPEPQRVVVDYSAPNLAKEMHVGHLRSTIIGDALVRVLGFLGHDVVRQNHVGDWGTPFGMLIEHLVDLGEETSDDVAIGDLTVFYQEARKKFDADTPFANRARRRVVQLQAGDDETLRLWRLLVNESKRHFNAVYRRLGVLLTDDDLVGESFYNDLLEPTCAELEERGIAVLSDGALCVFPPGFTGRDGGPMPLMIKKSDGGFGYDATDLAAVRYRTRDLDTTHLVYVVGAPQSQHLALVFAGATLAGWLGGVTGRRAVHVAFGSVLGGGGKMLKTRAGDSAKLIDLLDEAVERAAAIVAERSELSADEQAAVAEAVGIGGVKYADLSSDRVKDYTFDYDRMLATDGNTAAYLQYAIARCRSIRRKGEAEHGAKPADEVVLGEPAERALALALLRLDAAVRATASDLAPHKLCGHLFDLAQAFTSFYDACPVLTAPNEATRGSRLALCLLTADALALGLGLLGIRAPERM